MTEYRYCPICARPLEWAEVAGRKRQYCAGRGCDFVHWDNPVPVVAAIVERKGKVILARNKDWPEKWYALITGFLERDESPEEGILREVKEELSLSAEVVSLVGVYEFIRKNQVIIAYHVRAEGEIRLGEELADYKAIEPERLKPWPSGTGDAVRDWLAARKKRGGK